MSVYIPSMVMPKNCRECPLEQPYDGYNCAVNKRSYSWGLIGRPSDCPLVPIPDHGDLIDADALCEGLASNHPVVIHAKCAPTIIPADKEGET